MTSICPRCRIRPKKKHFNSKWCSPCAAELRRRPAGKLSPSQERTVRRLSGTMFIKDLAKKVGTSDSNLDRWARDHGVNLNALKYPEELVREVCDYYFEHGRPETEKRFPNVTVRSIVERYAKGQYARQKRWTAEQILELAQMAGLISKSAQARYFNRPRANAGSIQSAWVKKFGQGGAQLNGLSWHYASRLVGRQCKPLKTAFWSQRKDSKRGQFSRRIVIWTDLEKHLEPACPEWIREAVEALARFQRWLHGVDHVRPRITRLIKEREKHGRRTTETPCPRDARNLRLPKRSETARAAHG